MEFTWDGYRKLIHSLREHNYEISSYSDYEHQSKSVILRHDVDYSLLKAEEMAKIEAEIGVKSTYFILLSTGFYNIFSPSGRKSIEKILSYGHSIGLHFDEVVYENANMDELVNHISKESEILAEVAKMQINIISMHRPSQQMLKEDLMIPGKVNTYGKIFFKDIKYVSDSRMYWREDIDSYIEKEQFQKMQIVTHPFWYADSTETMQYKIKTFIKDAPLEKYELMKDNFRDLHEVLKKEELEIHGN